MKPHLKPSLAQLKLNAIIKRASFYTGGAGHLYDTKHSSSWSDYGYPSALDFWFYYNLYRRIGLARAVVERPADMCWIDAPKVKLSKVSEDEKGEPKDDEKFKKIAKRLRLWPICRQVDYMQRSSHYAGVIIRVADGKTLDQPLEKVSSDKVVSIMPAWEGQLVPGTLDNDPRSQRYGMPINYTYSQTGVRQESQRDGTDHFTIHHSRVWIWNEGAAGNTIYGTSELESVYNAIIDWEKIRGAGGEGFRKQATLRAVLQAMKETQGQAPTDEELDALTEVLTEMNTSFDAAPYLGGMELNTLETSLSNPEHFKNTALEDVAAGAKWSAKGLIGSQTGVMAGDQDSILDKQTAQSRRENYLSYQILDFINWLELYTTDFEAVEREVEWSDLLSPDDKTKIQNVVSMADANHKQWQSTGDTVFTGDEMRELGGWSPIGLEGVEGFVDGGDQEDVSDDQ